jgi:hypothetical protein
MSNPNALPLIQTIANCIERELDDNAPIRYEEMYGTVDDTIARIRSEMTQDDWDKWDIREGESDLEHARRCSAQLWAEPTHSMAVTNA